MTHARDIQHILVALDASTHSLAALEAGAKLAADLKGELLGLFVEDINLLRLAELPCAGEVVYASSHARTLDLPRLERALRVQAAEMERALAVAAEATNVHWTFRVCRGQVTNEVLAAAQEADMVVLGRFGRSLARRSRLGSTAQAAAAKAASTVMLLERGVVLGGPVLVLFDGAKEAFRALATAAQLLEDNEQDLIVLVPGEDSETCGRLRAQVEGWLREQTRRARCRTVGEGLAKLVEAVRQEGAGTLVLPADHRTQEELLSDLMNEVKCPVVLVR